MKIKTYNLLLLSATLILSSNFHQAKCQTIINRDNRIAEAVNMISADNLKIYVDNLLKFYTRHNLSDKKSVDKGIGAAALYLEKTIRKISENSVNKITVEQINYRAGGKDSRLGREITLSNVVATIHGADAGDNRIIALLAHYDNRIDDNNDSISFAPGANDNGSGVSALIEITRVLARYKLPLTVKVMFLSGEEHGLLGAAHMAGIAKKESWNLIAVLNNDMIGNSHSSDTDIKNNSIVRVFSENIPFVENDSESKERIFNSAENDSPSRQLARYIKETGERYVDNLKIKLIYRNDRFGRGGDHTPFSKNGYTAVRLCEFYENYDRTHQKVGTRENRYYGDTPEGVDFEYVRKNTGVNLSTIMNLAYAPKPPQNVYTNVSGLSNKTIISWEKPNSGTEPDGYYLLIRETDQSMWERKIFIKGETIEIPLSKDNYLFGVQSVGQNGNESLIVFSKGKR